jgi:AcrR family transcriptional regulator
MAVLAMAGKSEVAPGARRGAGANGMAAAGVGHVGGIGRGRVDELQRARILGAMVELVRERGVGNVTVAHVVARSGVSRRTFYELFEDREACFLAAFDNAVAQIAECVVPAYASAGAVWRERVRAGLAALLELIDVQPAIGALCVVDALAGGRVVLERRRAVVDALVEVVHEGRREAQSVRRPGRLVAEGVVGGLLSVLYGRLSAREPEPLLGLLNPLTAMVVLPYLGPAAANRELARRAPCSRRVVQEARPAGDPLRGLDMRVTYRTVRVLLAVAELGGRDSMGGQASNNRQVADAAGVSDQGQISKLLWRLEHLGLIANDAPRLGRGEPNAWTLTARGREVERAIRVQTAQ